jgi:putative ABC transport system permease protein
MRADENDTCVISTDLAQNLRLEIGDWIEVETGDERRSFRVVGLAIDNSVFLGSTVAGKVFLRDDLVAMMQRHEGWAYFFAIAFDRHDLQSVEARMGELSTKFRGYQLGSDSATRETRGAKEQTRILSLALYAMSLIIGIIGALGVLNTLTLNVLERRREIGVLRALGASDANLIVAFLSEGLALGFIGWVVGVLLGYPLGLFFTGLMQAVLFHIDYVFSAPMVGASLAFALVISGAASLIPALGAARLRVGQVLRYE